MDPVSLFSAEDEAALGSFAKPADPPAPPPAAPPAPPAPPAAATPPADPPAPPPAAPVAPSVPGTQELLDAQKQTMESINKLVEKIAGPSAPATPPVDASKAEREAYVKAVADEHPELKPALDALFDTQERLANIEKANLERQSAEDLQRRTQAEADRLVAEAETLIRTFPALTEPDVVKCLEWIADEKNDAEARGMSFRMVAEKVLGMDYLDARRTPPGVPGAGDPPAPRKPEPPAASIVAHAAPGTGAPPRSAPPASDGDLRTTFNDILASPEDRARLGRYGP